MCGIHPFTLYRRISSLAFCSASPSFPTYHRSASFVSYQFSFCCCQNQTIQSLQPLLASALPAPSRAFSLLILRAPVAGGAHILSLASIQLSQKRFSTDVVQMQNRFSKSEVHGVSETFPRASATLTLQL